MVLMKELMARWLGLRRRRRMVCVLQRTASDCGPACLAIVLTHLGRDTDLREIAEDTGLGTGPMDARALLVVARRYGLEGEGVRIESVDDLRLLPTGAILHWRFNHFVVFDGLETRGVRILDPAVGRRVIDRSEAGRSLSGTALVFRPTREFAARKSKKHSPLPALWALLVESGVLAKVVGLSALTQLLALAVPLLTKLVVDRVIPTGSAHLLLALALGTTALFVFHFLTLLVRSLFLLRLRTHVDHSLSVRFFAHLLRLPFAFFQRHSAGDLVTRLASSAVVREILASSVVMPMLDGTVAALYAVVLFAVDARIGLVAILLGGLRVGIFIVARRRQSELMAEALEADAQARALAVQALGGIESVKASAAENEIIATWMRPYGRQLTLNVERGRLDGLCNALIEALGVASNLALLIVCGSLVLRGDITLGTMFALQAIGSGFLTPLSLLVSQAFQLQVMLRYFERIDDVMREDRESEGVDRPSGSSYDGRFSLENVTYQYDSVSRPAVDGVSLTVEPGEFVAIVGPSGSGKSTVARLVACLLDPQSGRLLFDGRNVPESGRRFLHERMGYVAQSSSLFGISIRENICLVDPGIPMDRVIGAARLACIHEEIAALPMGYDTILADNGSSLSGGQRQRIALARALVHRPRLLILDEATSALDPMAELKVHENLAQLQCTRVMISHRLSTLRHTDRIVVMEKGRISACGSFNQLLDEDHTFRTLLAAESLRGDRATPGVAARRAGADDGQAPVEAKP